MNALAAIHVAKKQLGLDDETYRAMLMRVTGKSSAREMTEQERKRVVAELRGKGFKPASKGTRKRLEGVFAGKLQALWIGGWNLGVVRDKTDAALISFVQRQTGVDHVRFLHHPEDASKAIDGLKAWLTREAKVDWGNGRYLPDWQRPLGAKIALAQWQRLIAAGEEPMSITAFRDFVARHGVAIDRMEERDWIPVMNAFGERVRKVVR